MQTAVQELAQAIGVVCCDASLYTPEQQTKTIRYEYLQGEIDSAQGAVLPLEQDTALYRQIMQGQTFQCCFLPATPNLIRNIAARMAVLVCPLMDDRGVLGDLWLFKSRETPFEDLEIRLAQQVANHCAIALRQARLYQAVQNQVRELEKLNRLKDDFLSTVSHELRTPVSNMKMAIHLLRNIPTPEKRECYLNILNTECQRELNLVNDLLDLQRLESGTWEFTAIEAVDLAQFIPSIVAPICEQAATQKQVQVNLCPSLPVVQIDRVSLKRIVTELLTNACKYTRSSAAIQCSMNVIAAEAAVATLVITVQNAAEIPPSELPRIFDKFYRIPNADPWKQGGTGLGLALVRKLAERLGGSIQVTSGQGLTTAEVQLPVHSDASVLGLPG